MITEKDRLEMEQEACLALKVLRVKYLAETGCLGTDEEVMDWYCGKDL